MCVALLALVPFDTTVVPVWRLRIVDTAGTPCGRMRVTQTWQHYSIELEPMGHEDVRLTDGDGYVEFPRRTIRATLFRRSINSAAVYAKLIAHGSVGPHGTVFISVLKDLACPSYRPGKSLPDKGAVEQCIDGGA